MVRSFGSDHFVEDEGDIVFYQKDPDYWQKAGLPPSYNPVSGAFWVGRQGWTLSPQEDKRWLWDGCTDSFARDVSPVGLCSLENGPAALLLLCCSNWLLISAVAAAQVRKQVFGKEQPASV